MLAMGVQDGDKDPLSHLGGFGMLGLVCTIFRAGDREVVGQPPGTAPPPHLLCSIAQFIQLLRAGQVTQQPNHPQGDVGVDSALDSDRQSPPEAPNSS